MITGLEPALTKTASSSAAKAAGPLGGRLLGAWRKRQIKRELQTGVTTYDTNFFLETLNEETAAELVQFAASAELKSLAMSFATDDLLTSVGRNKSKIDRELKAQLRSLISVHSRGELAPRFSRAWGSWVRRAPICVAGVGVAAFARAR